MMVLMALSKLDGQCVRSQFSHKSPATKANLLPVERLLKEFGDLPVLLSLVYWKLLVCIVKKLVVAVVQHSV